MLCWRLCGTISLKGWSICNNQFNSMHKLIRDSILIPDTENQKHLASYNHDVKTTCYWTHKHFLKLHTIISEMLLINKVEILICDLLSIIINLITLYVATQRMVTCPILIVLYNLQITSRKKLPVSFPTCSTLLPTTKLVADTV